MIVESDAAAAARGLSARLEAGGIRALGMTEQDYSLEDVFILIVERSHREGAAAAA